MTGDGAAAQQHGHPGRRRIAGHNGSIRQIERGNDERREAHLPHVANQIARRLGLILAALSFTLMLPWGASMAVWTSRIEKGFPGLTFTSLTCLAAGAAMTYIIFVIWSVAAFRPDQYDPATVLMFVNGILPAPVVAPGITKNAL